MKFHILITVFITFLLTVKGFPDGAPIDTCVRPRPNQPNHGQSRPQPPETNPFQVLQSSDQYGPGTQITVTIQGAAHFKGFFIQARDVARNEWIGQWVEDPNTKIHPECSSITHADPRPKQSATLIWQAPPNVAPGQVYFTGTVLKEYSEYWSNIISQVAQ